MESRVEARESVHLKVVLHAKGNNLLSGRVRNLSPRGLYVQIDPEGIGRDSMLRVGLMVENQLQVLRARVARKTEDGLGLEIVSNDTAVRRALKSLGTVRPQALSVAAGPAP